MNGINGQTSYNVGTFPPSGGVRLPGIDEAVRRQQGGNVSGGRQVETKPLASLPTLAQTRGTVAQETAVPDTNLRGAGKSGAKAFFSAVKDWFKTTFSRKEETYLPQTMGFTLPNGKRCTMEGAQFEPMLKALPKGERAAAALTLQAHLQERIETGGQIYADIQKGRAATPPTEQNVADLTLFLRASAAAKGDNFASGSLSIEDKGGVLLAYLKSSQDGYVRASSHLKGLTKDVLPDGDTNLQRSIDVKLDSNGLPGGHRTVLFGAIPSDGKNPQRLFLKTESHGCRLSTMKAATKRSGRVSTGGADRPFRKGDFSEAVSHTFSFFETRGKGSAAGTRKEHLPKDVKKAYENAVKKLEKMSLDPFCKDICDRLKASKADVGGYGLKNLVKALDSIKVRRDDINPLINAIEVAISALPHQDNMEVRMGNEAILQKDDLG